MRRDGKRFRTPHLEVRYLASLLRRPRVGLIVPKHKQTAVARNRVKRRLRECARLTLLPALRARAPLDVVLRATPAAYGAAGVALADEMRRIADRLAASVRPREEAGTP